MAAFMDPLLLLKALILGVVEGFTEFLPISSTGHLIIASELIGFDGASSKVFIITIQLGAILAVCWEYRARLGRTIRGLPSDPVAQRFAMNLAIAVVPAALLGLAFHKTIKSVLFAPIPVAVALVVGGLLILWVERRPRTARILSFAVAAPRAVERYGCDIMLSFDRVLRQDIFRSGGGPHRSFIKKMTAQSSMLRRIWYAIPFLAVSLSGAAVLGAWRGVLGSRWIAWLVVLGGASYGAASLWVTFTHDQRVSPMFAIGVSMMIGRTPKSSGSESTGTPSGSPMRRVSGMRRVSMSASRGSRGRPR